MEKTQALDSFWNSFEWPAIDEQSAYDEGTLDALDITDRYITYEVQTSNFGDPVAMTASLWHRSTKWAEISRKANEIAAYIGYGGKVIPVDGGYLWIKLGAPFAQRMVEDSDLLMRRIILNIAVDFLTAV